MSLFQHNTCHVDNTLTRFSGLRSLCRTRRFSKECNDQVVAGSPEMVGQQGRVQFLTRKMGSELVGCTVFIQTDGAWKANSGYGAAAWVQLNSEGLRGGQSGAVLLRVVGRYGGDPSGVGSSSMGF